MYAYLSIQASTPYCSKNIGQVTVLPKFYLFYNHPAFLSLWDSRQGTEFGWAFNGEKPKAISWIIRGI